MNTYRTPAEFVENVIDQSPLPDQMAVMLDTNDKTNLDLLDDEPTQVDGVPADAICRILHALVLSSHSAPTSPAYWSHAVVRLAALAWSVDPQVRQYSQQSIAAALGKTRALLCARIVELRDLGALGTHGGKTQTARKTLSDSARRGWQNRREVGNSEKATQIDSNGN